ncbi:hypothetical protein NQ317_006777 [Molorchus minor]|uniref:Uncharacterized protein n=1 Tax=Molorchus minor TaxID=1323400 RepID=A0ABQ9IWX9_9CUCU|nr:hypothetical protein NQ317_006777 [Molorchus minor]
MTSCKKCKKRHNSFLHFETPLNDSNENKAEEVQVKNKINHAVSGVGKSVTNIKYSVNMEIRSQCNTFKVNLSFLVINSITEKLPVASFDAQELNIPENIHLHGGW